MSKLKTQVYQFCQYGSIKYFGKDNIDIVKETIKPYLKIRSYLDYEGEFLGLALVFFVLATLVYFLNVNSYICGCAISSCFLISHIFVRIKIRIIKKYMKEFEN